MQNKVGALLFFLLTTITSYSQEFEAEPSDKVVIIEGDTIIYNPEVDPVFPGGHAAMDEYFRKNLPGYSKTKSRKNNKVMWVSFVIRSNGKIGVTNIIINDRPEVAKTLNQVLRSLPAWTPAVYKGKNVATIGDYHFYFE